jgi:preprotein translocase subunit SecA
MVSKAIERAQNTVEQRNAEIRKNVLKYDEVMNEQRKVIYRRRDQVLDGVDLQSEVEESLAASVDKALATFCPGDFPEDWDVEGLRTEIGTYWPATLTVEQLAAATNGEELYELVMGDALAHYAGREEQLGAEALREIERQIMLRIIDSRWREHLREMDHLQDGIGLRAMGQKDPLVEWQREGFDMFGQLMESVADEFVKYVMHAQVVVDEDSRPAVSNVQESGPDGASAGAAALARAAAGTTEEAALQAPDPAPQPEPVAQQPVRKSDWDKTPRNAPCPCGSGKKFKQCHGAA